MTGYVTLLAEELDVPPAQITRRLLPFTRCFRIPLQLTGESRSMSSRWVPIRETGARARQMLLAAAAQRWQVDAATLDDEWRSCGHRPAWQALWPMPNSRARRRRCQCRMRSRCETGGQIAMDWSRRCSGRISRQRSWPGAYGIDTRSPGLKVAVVRRPPADSGGSAHDMTRQLPAAWRVWSTSFRSTAVSPSLPIISGRHSRRRRPSWPSGSLARWPASAVPRFGSEQGRQLDSQSGHRVRDDGEADSASQRRARIIEAEYWVPYLAHATMEPMNATVWFHDGGCEAWVPTQASGHCAPADLRLSRTCRERRHSSRNPGRRRFRPARHHGLT